MGNRSLRLRSDLPEIACVLRHQGAYKMRISLFAILSILLLGTSVRAQNVQLALDGAADLSPVYPTARIPANAGQLVVVFTYGDQQRHLIHTEITPITAVG
jgi:hypothetical protein